MTKLRGILGKGSFVIIYTKGEFLVSQWWKCHDGGRAISSVICGRSHTEAMPRTGDATMT